MKLPKELEVKRDELAKSRAVQIEIKQRQNPTLSVFENANRSYIKGFDAGAAEVLARAELLFEAMTHLECDCDGMSRALGREIICLRCETLAEWESFIGEK